MAHKLSILVPVFNEAPTAERLLRRVLEVPFPIEREVIVVDDASTDGCSALLSRLADELEFTYVRHQTNGGKGAAIQTALVHAHGDIIVVQDADFELDPADLTVLLEPILRGDTQVCFGSRFWGSVPWSIKRRPTYLANRILNGICNLLNGIKITDFNTCYKMMTAEVISRISIRESGFAMEPEITTKLARLGVSILERPVSYEPRSFGAGKKIRLRDVLQYLRAMLQYRFFWSTARGQKIEPRASAPVSMPLANLGPSPLSKERRALGLGAGVEQ